MEFTSMPCYNSWYRMTAAMLVTSGGLTRQGWCSVSDSTDDTPKRLARRPYPTPEDTPWPELREMLRSDQQRETFDAIVHLINKNGAYPSLADLHAYMGVKQTNIGNRITQLDGEVLIRTAYFERVDFNKLPRVLVNSPRLRTHEDQEHRFWIAVNRPKLSARKRHAKKRAKNAVVEGSYTTQDIRDLLFMQRGRCWWCQCELEGKFHADHRIPLARGGSNYAENICLSCPTCNTKKGDKMPWEFCGRLL